MATPEEPSSPKGFNERLRAAQERRRDRSGTRAGGAPSSALGLGFRIGIELVSALVVGVGIGWLLDRWLGTQPWLLLLCFLLGSAAGVLNVYRTVGRMGTGAGTGQSSAADAAPRRSERE